MTILDSAELLLQAHHYGGAGNWLDEANSHDATPVNAPAFTPGTVGNAYFTLTGTEYFNIADDPGLNFNNQNYSLMVVAAADDFAAERALLSKFTAGDAPANTGYELTVRTNPTIRTVIGDGSGNNDEAGTPLAGIRMSGGGTYEDAAPALTAYFNGVGSGSPSVTARGDISNGKPLRIGARSTTAPALQFIGKIYAVALWRALLTPTEMAEAHDLLMNGVPPPSPGSPGEPGALTLLGCDDSMA